MRGKDKKVVLTVAIPKQWHKHLHALARAEYCSVSDIVRQQIKKILSQRNTNVLCLNETDSQNTEDTDDE